MITINANTKISTLIKSNPDAIDAIAGINPHFKKLKNPVLRKILASRVTIREAAKIGKCDIEVFFEKLKPLGFVVNEQENAPLQKQKTEISPGKPFDVQLDVRSDIEAGRDPFRKIMQQLSDMPEGKTMLLINSFEPLPLIRILEGKGYETDVATISADEVHTYFRKQKNIPVKATVQGANNNDFGAKQNEYRNRLHTIDVRSLPMPKPMMTILEALETLPEDMALFVYHKKVPLFLLPELKERNFEFVFRQDEHNVELIIYRNRNTE